MDGKGPICYYRRCESCSISYNRGPPERLNNIRTSDGNDRNRTILSTSSSVEPSRYSPLVVNERRSQGGTQPLSPQSPGRRHRNRRSKSQALLRCLGSLVHQRSHWCMEQLAGARN